MTSNDYVPFKITGINSATVGSPTNDGTPGSGLYAVPFNLSRGLDEFEQIDIIEAWNSPSSFSTMHRPGIARCYGDKFVLAGTTIEEVRDYHKATLKDVEATVNRLSEERHLRAIADEAKRRAFDESHKKNVERVAKDLEF